MSLSLAAASATRSSSRGHECHEAGTTASHCISTKILDFGGFDPGRILIFNGWNSHVLREFPGKFGSTNLSSSDDLSREIGPSPVDRWVPEPRPLRRVSLPSPLSLIPFPLCLSVSLSLSLYIYIYTYIYTCTYAYIHAFICRGLMKGRRGPRRTSADCSASPSRRPVRTTLSF